MRGVRFTKAERAWMRGWLEEAIKADADVGDRKAVKLAESVLSKLELAEMPVARGTYLTVDDAIEAFSEVLGARLLAPEKKAVGVRSQMKSRIQALGLTRADCTTVAKVAAAKWQGVIRAESLVRQADRLMAESQLEFAPPPRQQVPSPVELGDDEI